MYIVEREVDKRHKDDTQKSCFLDRKVQKRDNNKTMTWKLSLNSNRVLIKSWLFCIENFSCSVKFQGMLGACVEVWKENILEQFIGNQTHLSTTWHDKMSLTSNEPINKVLCSNLHINSKHARKTYRTWKDFCAKEPTPNQNSVYFMGLGTLGTMVILWATLHYIVYSV